MENYSAYSAPEIVRILGARFKDYRMRANLTQKEVSEKAGITIQTIHRFESGLANNITLGNFLMLLKTVGSLRDLDSLMPEQPESPYLLKNRKKTQRIRHKKEQL